MLLVSEEVDLRMQAFSEEKVSEFALDQFFSSATKKNLAGMVNILLTTCMCLLIGAFRPR